MTPVPAIILAIFVVIAEVGMRAIGVRELKQRARQVLAGCGSTERKSRSRIDVLARRRQDWLASSGSEGPMLRLPLVTWDVEQRDRAAQLIDVLVPEGEE